MVQRYKAVESHPRYSTPAKTKNTPSTGTLWMASFLEVLHAAGTLHVRLGCFPSLRDVINWVRPCRAEDAEGLASVVAQAGNTEATHKYQHLAVMLRLYNDQVDWSAGGREILCRSCGGHLGHVFMDGASLGGLTRCFCWLLHVWW